MVMLIMKFIANSRANYVDNGSYFYLFFNYLTTSNLVYLVLRIM